MIWSHGTRNFPGANALVSTESDQSPQETLPRDFTINIYETSKRDLRYQRQGDGNCSGLEWNIT